MRKSVLALIVLLALSAGTCFAAPINDLANGQTAVGIMVHNSDPGSDTFYLEHRLSDNFTLGFQSVDWNHGGSMTDFYGQLHLSNNLRAIIGTRDFGATSKMYLGVAANGPLSPEWNGYASFISGNSFNELQVGANHAIARNLDLNINYRAFMPDGGSDVNGLGLGLTLKF